MIFYFLYYFSSFRFIFIHSRFISFFLFSFFFYLLFSSTQVSSPPSFIFFFTSRTFQQLICFTLEREREREREGCLSAAPPSVEIEVTERTKSVEIGVHPCDTTTFAAPSRLFLLPTTKLVQIGVLFSFSYLLVLIQLYFKNWILFCVLCFVFGLIILLMNKSLFSLFSFFFPSIFLISFGL